MRVFIDADGCPVVDETIRLSHGQGKECIIGHFEDNIFHIVFLDKNHEFWISKKKNT